MAGNGKPPVLVIVQLSGGNDFMNTIVPYTSSVYHDVRKKIKVEQDEVLPIDDSIGFNPNLAPLKEMYDAGDVAIVQGIGFPDSDRSHFRAMDIWHTCEPKRIVLEGWLGKTIRELDPNKENVLTGVNIGRGLPRALTAAGVPVASVGDLGQLWTHDRHLRGGRARGGLGRLQGDVQPGHRIRARHGVLGQHRGGRAERPGHAGGGAGQVQLGRGVR